LVVLLTHLLKWHYQPERRGSSWERTIREQRRALLRRLQKTPSLKTCLDDCDWWEDVWLDTRTETVKETGIEFDQFPATCSWTPSEVLTPEWLPE
ncbi:DUF29 domain-containing protein, partial [Chromatium okenii]|uniref:DUF29 domain-containing protein n=1 Tax=Chromatium okenii TaxID=61644 RepID=UPI0026E95C88